MTKGLLSDQVKGLTTLAFHDVNNGKFQWALDLERDSKIVSEELHAFLAKEAHLQAAVRRDTQPVAAAAEVVAHGRDEPDPSCVPVCPVPLGRVVRVSLRHWLPHPPR